MCILQIKTKLIYKTMGRICPILNHPLKDGVLVEDETLVKFIQKRNLDFLPNELVCLWCKQEVTKLYNKKLRKAIELRREKSRLREESVSSLKTSKSSSASTTSVRSLQHSHSIQQRQVLTVPNGNEGSSYAPSSELNSSKSSAIEQNDRNNNVSSNIPNVATAELVSTAPSTSISNTHTILQENQKNQETNKRTPTVIFGQQLHVTVRKKTIKDYLTSYTTRQTITKEVATAEPITADDEDDVMRRLSQEPTTSNAANTNKRRLAQIVDSDDDAVVSSSSQEATRSTVVNANKRRIVAVDGNDDDDERLSLNAVNGTRLPHIQPIPPKRKPRRDQSNTLARDIMNEYIKDVTGG